MNARTLASSRHYRVEHEYESASLVTGDGRKRVIGEFYGDPAVALIDGDEQWCAVAGEGLIVCSLAPGGACVEYYRKPGETLWITGLRQTGPFALEATGEDGTVRLIDIAYA